MENDLVKFTKEMLSIESISSQGKDCSKITEACDLLCNYLSPIGFKCRHFPVNNGKIYTDSLYAKYGSGKKNIMFSGHVDVVPAGNIENWDSHPFSAEEKDGYIVARGVADMKGGVTCFAHAAKRFINDYKDFDGSISMMIAGDEEEPFIETTKEMCEILSKEGEVWDIALVGEPSNSYKIGDTIKNGRRGGVEVRIESFGTQGHDAYPHLADNAIHHLVELTNKYVNKKLDDGNKYFPSSSLQIINIDVDNKSTNTIPGFAKCLICIRFNNLQNVESIKKFFNEEIEKTEGNFKIDFNFFGEPFLTSSDNFYLQNLKGIIKTNTNINPELSTAGGTSDGRYIKDYCDVFEFGLVNDSIHKTNEKARVSDLILLEKIYYDFLVKSLI